MKTVILRGTVALTLKLEQSISRDLGQSPYVTFKQSHIVACSHYYRE